MAVVFIITTAVTVIVIVFLVLRKNRGDNSIGAGLQKYVNVYCISHHVSIYICLQRPWCHPYI